jgi:ATPase subunit of ABC transporter with duplicated ATPase domains
MASFNLRNVSFIATAPLFTDINLVISPADRLGLVARNGAGKSTLLKCLAGLFEPTGGTIGRSRGLRVGVVEQDLPTNLLDLPLGEALRRAIPPGERDLLGWRVDLVLDQFATPQELRGRPVRALSGGWQRLALIARTWVTEPDALLLDEPTNHLDLPKIQLLETWINDQAGQLPMVIASHDRQFLDACTNKTLFLRATESRLYAHPYSRARKLLADDDTAAETRRAKDKREVQRLRHSAQELRNIGINSRSDAAQKKSAQMARRADALEHELPALHAERPGDIRLANRHSRARVLVALDKVQVQAPDGAPLLQIGKLEVCQGDRIVLLGRNGVGKSQLVGLLRRSMTTPGSVAGITVSPSVVAGYLDQQMSQLPEGETAERFISSTFRLGDQRSLSLLAGAGFAVDKQRQPIARLSPGEKARLGLLALRLAAPNFHLLDEPTSHLDIAGQEQLETELVAQAATGVLVTHDRRFARAVGTRFLMADGGRLRELDRSDAALAALLGHNAEG